MQMMFPIAYYYFFWLIFPRSFSFDIEEQSILFIFGANYDCERMDGNEIHG
jgi:hypothetical protein